MKAEATIRPLVSQPRFVPSTSGDAQPHEAGRAFRIRRRSKKPGKRPPGLKQQSDRHACICGGNEPPGTRTARTRLPAAAVGERSLSIPDVLQRCDGYWQDSGAMGSASPPKGRGICRTRFFMPRIWQPTKTSRRRWTKNGNRNTSSGSSPLTAWSKIARRWKMNFVPIPSPSLATSIEAVPPDSKCIFSPLMLPEPGDVGPSDTPSATDIWFAADDTVDRAGCVQVDSGCEPRCDRRHRTVSGEGSG